MFIHRKAFRPQRHSLVHAHAFPNDRRLANDHSGAVINEKTLPDLRAWMNLDARDGMGDFRNHACEKWSSQAMQFMGEPVMRNGGNAGIADKHLVDSSRRRVSFVGCVNITIQQAANVRQPFCKCLHNASCGLQIHFTDGLAIPG